jgi:hypothetical protein
MIVAAAVHHDRRRGDDPDADIGAPRSDRGDDTTGHGGTEGQGDEQLDNGTHGDGPFMCSCNFRTRAGRGG